MSESWFYWYIEQVNKAKDWASYQDRFLCPCCYMPTLEERASYEICPICFWEDDGQDSDDADLVRGGPNHGYSLSEARSNFAKHHTMYAESDTHHFAREMADMPFKKELYAAFVDAIRTKDSADFARAVALQQSNDTDEYVEEENTDA